MQKQKYQAWTTSVKLLLLCGMASSVLYVVADITSSLRYEGYIFADQAVSELMAIGAPTRLFTLSLMTVYGLLVAGFTAGIIISAGNKRALLLVGLLTLGYAIDGQVCTTFFPMHMRGAAKGLSDEMHKILTFVSVFFTLVSMGFAAYALGRKFRIYTIATMLFLTGFGILAGGNASRLDAGLTTPWLGIQERINIYLTMVWIAVLALNLWKMRNEQR